MFLFLRSVPWAIKYYLYYTFEGNFEKITMFEVHHAWKPHDNSVFNVKQVYEKTSSNKYLNSNLSVNNIASYIFKHIFVAAIIPEDPCGRWTPMLFDTELCAIQSWKRVIWQYSS
jgi:hypothetical protein